MEPVFSFYEEESKIEADKKESEGEETQESEGEESEGEESEDEETALMRMIDIFPNLPGSVPRSLCKFIQRFYPAKYKTERILSRLQKEKNSTILLHSTEGNPITNITIHKNEIDDDKERQEFCTSLILMFGTITCFVLYFVLMDLTKNDKGGFDYNVNLFGGIISFFTSVLLFIYCGLTDGWDVYTLTNFTNACLGRVFISFAEVSVIFGLSFGISASLANVIKVFFSFPLIMIIKGINGNKDMTISSKGICLVIISNALLITFYFNIFEASPIGLTFLFIGAISSAFHAFSTGIYFGKIRVGKATTIFFCILPTSLFMCIVGTVQELIKGKSFEEIIFAIPFGMYFPWLIFALINPIWMLVGTELCKISPFYNSIAEFIAVFIISVAESIKDFFKAGTSPDFVYLLGVLSLIMCGITFMLSMKSKLSKLKAMQGENSELELLRIERIVNLESIALAEKEMIDENEIEIALLKRDENEESFTHELLRFKSTDDLEKLKEAILKKYTDAKKSFINEHDFDFFGMGDDLK